LSDCCDLWLTVGDVDVGLSHEDNMYKMRVLTFVQLAEGKSELSFETIEKELDLGPDDVEAFIIDGNRQSCS